MSQELDLEKVLRWLEEHADDPAIRQRVLPLFGAMSLPSGNNSFNQRRQRSNSFQSAFSGHLDLDSEDNESLHRSISSVNRLAKRYGEDDFSSVEAALAGGLENLLEEVYAMIQHKPPQYDIEFKDLSYCAEVDIADDTIATVGSQLLEMLCLCKRKPKARRTVLSNLTGKLKAGTATLILGPPRSGKSAFMKVLAGRAVENGSCRIDGEVLYNGKRKSDLQLPRLAGYISQRDLHLPTLTVRETLDFGRLCTGGSSVSSLLADQTESAQKLLKLYDLSLELQMTLLGIAHVADTLVGDEVIRGISGGQRKRVTSGEMLAVFLPMLFADEISTGLDSAATYDICKSMILHSHVFRSLTVISLLQPPPEVFDLFDNILVIDKGHIIYHGPREKVMPFFESIGYERPPTKDIADFLQEVSTELGAGFVARGAKPPRTPEEISRAFRESEYFGIDAEARQAVTGGNTGVQSADTPFTNFFQQEYPNSFAVCFKLLLRRQLSLIRKNTTALRARFGQSIMTGILTGTLFWQMPMDNAQLHYGVLFNSLMSLSLGGMSSIPQVVQERDVAIKQMSARFYPAGAYALATTISLVPTAILETLIFGSIVYWFTGLANEFTRYLFFLLTLFLSSMSMTSLFRLIAVSSPNATGAQSVGSLIVLVSILFCGFMITKGNIKAWWVWAYWTTPLSWSFTALALNEYKAAKYNIPFNPMMPNLTLGDKFLMNNDFTTDGYRQYTSLLYLVAFITVMVSLFSLALKCIRWPETHDTVKPPHPSDAPSLDAAPSSEPGPTDKTRLVSVRSEIDFTPVTLSFHEICYSVTVPHEKTKFSLRLLDVVSGYALPGTMTALMGSSGAGKTTLLDVLAFRKTGGLITGEVLLNGHPADPLTFTRLAGYVEQMDIHSPSATVLEALRFSAALRLPRTTSDDDKEAFVQRVMHLLELEPLAGTMIGKKGQGLSVEQAKRVTIGVELVANPSILFLDEPTSGLDSRAAQIVMRAIRNIAKTGRTVICTIHQPSNEIFSMFDSLLLLKKGGETVFFGELGKDSCNLINHLQSIPDAPRFQPSQNPATYMLDVIGAGTGGQATHDFSLIFQRSAMCADMQKRLREIEQKPGAALRFDDRFAAPMSVQLKMLFRKSGRAYWRSPQYNLTRSILNVVIALLLGSIYYQIKVVNIPTMFSMTAVQFLAAAFLGVLNFVSILPVMALERAAYYRERASNMYSVQAYAVAFAVVELPFLFTSTLLFCGPFYWMVGLKSDAKAFAFWTLTHGLYTAFMTFYGMMLSVLLPDQTTAQLAGTALVTLWNLFCGFIVPKESIPVVWKFLYYMNPLTYTIQAMLSSQYHCEGPDCPMMEALDFKTGKMVPVSVWKYAQAAFGLDYDNIWYDILILFACFVTCRIGTVLGQKYVVHATR
eukprot:NODE_15_length_4507_cov_49.404653_g13_i0.p1 GENE.NODE_15_length_4507_cov_49.404653_g13_i0~~NODE_15_length_4507_cov_49.404653_g13_i0.p1  ORF type:complete len:1404 (+),score=270.35 NODE_15_length_4507_cov_49.404653_g13_i0:55-4266(+)